jgi:hypothetical protein
MNWSMIGHDRRHCKAPSATDHYFRAISRVRLDRHWWEHGRQWDSALNGFSQWFNKIWLLCNMKKIPSCFRTVYRFTENRYWMPYFITYKLDFVWNFWSVSLEKIFELFPFQNFFRKILQVDKFMGDTIQKN